MFDEVNFTMEKKVPSRQSPCLARNNGVISEKKSDYLSNKNGRPKKHRDSSNGGRSQDPVQQASKPAQKYRGGFGDKRPRQRGYLDYRQSEEVAEPYGLDVDLITSRKGKGNANHLLNFSYQDRSFHSSRGAGYWGGRKVYRHQTPSYKKEQYLQASCQFIVQNDGDYSQQAIDPDALVDWDNVQLVRTFSSELVTCPICLDVPIAAKITRCGHTYCWACILHYLQVNYSPKKDTVCPVCPEWIDSDKLRSVQNVVVPDFKVGDEIEMKLMRKSKGSVFVCPEEDWTGKEEGHLNMDAGTRTKFSKLLLASWPQVKAQVYDVEKEALCRGLVDAEQEEICFLQMAQHLLENQEASLNVKKKYKSTLIESEIQIATEPQTERNNEPFVEESKPEIKQLPPDISFDGSKILTQYMDAFDEEEKEMSATPEAAAAAEEFDEGDDEIAALDMSSVTFAISEDDQSSEGSGEQNMGSDSPKNVLKQGSPIADIHDTLTPEEAADHLELPDTMGARQQRTNACRPKDTYHFYQASTGQHIYMHSLNAQCLTREYGSLENSPRTVTATIIAIERIFMTEEMRKRLRYLNHIPLTTEFHVVELKIKPPVLSKETIKHFQPDFDKRRKFRQKKAKEEKIRASKNEVEHKKAHGIYVAPEVHIPLDNTIHFPSHLASFPEANERQRRESTNSDIFLDSGTSDGQVSPVSDSPRFGEAIGNSPSFASFAQKLRSNSIVGTGASPPAWPRVSSSLSHSATMPEMRARHAAGSNAWEVQEEDGEGGAYHAPSMATSWLESLHDLAAGPQASRNPEVTEASNGGKKKKKKKENQLLFSTSMVRKN